MNDFLSSHYLGMEHSSMELPAWNKLTLGVPAALSEASLSNQISSVISKMQGLEAGCLAPSTLHIYHDFYRLISNLNVILYIDNMVYPVSLYGLEQLLVKKKQVYKFRHLDAEDLKKKIKFNQKRLNIPVVITDGWCTRCGKAAPIAEYLNIVFPYKGLVVIDDTQAFGLLGKNKEVIPPFGIGGGGILKWLGIRSPEIVSIISLAKGFGVPVAIISGEIKMIEQFKRESSTRLHSSPVSNVVMQAVSNAIKLNKAEGDIRRKKLWQNILHLKRQLQRQQLSLQGGIFPIQTISHLTNGNVVGLYHYLKNLNINTILVASHLSYHPDLCIILNAGHSFKEIDELANAIYNYQNLTSKSFYNENMA